jgi:hypothetical protein
LTALIDTRREYDHLAGIYIPIAIGVFAAVLLATALAVLIYRGRAPAQAARWHEHNATSSPRHSGRRTRFARSACCWPSRRCCSRWAA